MCLCMHVQNIFITVTHTPLTSDKLMSLAAVHGISETSTASGKDRIISQTDAAGFLREQEELCLSLH